MSRQIGSEAEGRAVDFLKSKAYTILDTNFTTRFGEIDIVAREKDAIVFVEVKMRTSPNFGTGREYVTPKKLQKIIHTAQLFLTRHNLTKHPYRIDVVEVQGEKITHLKNITL